VRHVRMLGLCLVAVFAVGAYAVSSASALPEWGECVKVGSGGNYAGANCTKAEKAKPKGSGEYEWKKGAELPNVPFSGGSIEGGGVLYSQLWDCPSENEKEGYKILRRTRQNCEEQEYPAKSGEHSKYAKELGAEIECSSETNNGEASGKKSIVNVHATFKGCVLLGSIPCSNTPVEGEVKTELLKGQLGWISKSEKVVGVLLEPASGKHGLFAKFTCGFEGGGFVIGVGVGNKKEGAFYTSSGCSGVCEGTTPEEEKHGGYDGIISPIEPVNVMTNKYKQKFTINPTTDENIPSKLDGKHISLLESYTEYFEEGAECNGCSFLWGPSGEELTNENTATKVGEIKAG
jgi:hypothetical protein